MIARNVGRDQKHCVNRLLSDHASTVICKTGVDGKMLSEWLSISSQQEFTIIIAGRISGGPLEDARHRPITFQIREDELIIEFERGESLIVLNPSDISLEPNAGLVVKDGSEVRFTWYCYGYPLSPENLCEEIYWKVGKYMAFERRVPPLTIFEPFPTVGPVGGPGISLIRLIKR